MAINGLFQRTHLFIDESGNRDFSESGTNYWVLTCLATTDYQQGVLSLLKIKHELIESGLNIELFHASEDRQFVRDRIFQALCDLQDVSVYCVIVRKQQLVPSLRPTVELYACMTEYLFHHVSDTNGLNVSSFSKVIIFMDRVGSRNKERESILKGIKIYIHKHFNGVPYEILMHQSASHRLLQVVDYVSWALYVKWERNENRPYNMIKSIVKSEVEFFRWDNLDGINLRIDPPS